MDLPLPVVVGATLVLIRVSALVVSAPVLGSRTVPGRVKLALAFAVTVPVYLAAGAPRVDAPHDVGRLVALALSETALGLVSGLSARLVLEAAQAGGQAAGMSLGFGFGALIDPHSQAESTVVGELLLTVALAAAVALNVHGEAIAWLARSVVDVPPGAPVDVGSLVAGLLRQVIYALALAVRVAWPLFAAALFAFGTLGLLGRAAPSLSLSNVGFAVSVLAGGSVLYLLVPHAAWLCAGAAHQIFARS